MTFWKKSDFKALQKEWYQRLKDQGFDDAEELIGGELVLRQNAAHAYRSLDEITRDSKEAYYNFVAQKVQETTFTSDVDRLILVNHAAGKKICHIRRELQEAGTPRCRVTIRIKIRIYEMKWGLRQYTPKQLNRKVS